MITFSDFEVEVSKSYEKNILNFLYIQYISGCSYDWVMIIDGDGSTLLPKTCGSDIPTPIRSHTSTAVIVFHSDHSETFRGFNITWESRKSGFDLICIEMIDIFCGIIFNDIFDPTPTPLIR